MADIIEGKLIAESERIKLNRMGMDKKGKYVQELVKQYKMPNSAMINLSTGMFV